MTNVVIIVAGGSGSRMGSSIPKQFLEIAGKPVIVHTIEKFLLFDPGIELIMVINPSYLNTWDKLAGKYNLTKNCKVTPGGKTRFHSVKNGLMFVRHESLIGIHDAVRPLISVETIRNLYKQAAIYGNAIPAVPVNETVRETFGSSNRMIDRSTLKLIQTPQVFLYSIVNKAYETIYSSDFTDDASVVEKSGVDLNLIDGDFYNIKITTPEDIEIAKSLLSQ